jgi:hypothetical protein
MAYHKKSDSPYLYDNATGDIVGIQDPDGSEQLFPNFSQTVTLDPTTGLAIGRSEPTSVQRAAVRAGIGVIGVTDIVKSGQRTAEPVPSLDLNYAELMALAGVETYARTGTESYTNRLGAAASAAENVPAFDRSTNNIPNAGLVPFGYKSANSGQLSIADVSALLGASGFTIVVDTEVPNSLAGAGPVIQLSSGAVTNRVQIDRSSNYNAAFVVQSGGTVVVNQQLGGVGAWHGGTRRQVISVANSVFHLAENGQYITSVFAGNKPSGLVRLDIGYASTGPTYFTGWIKRIRIYPLSMTAKQALDISAGELPVAFWGDSLTAGIGAASDLTEVFRFGRYPRGGVFNGGVGGETSTQIKARAIADTNRSDWAQVVWAGRNNFTQQDTVLADIQAMVESFGHRRFVVLSIINKQDGTENSGSVAHGQIIALNAALAAKYPDNYLDIRSLMVAASGGTNDAINATWSTDGLHLNTTAKAYAAPQVYLWMNARGMA